MNLQQGKLKDPSIANDVSASIPNHSKSIQRIIDRFHLIGIIFFVCGIIGAIYLLVQLFITGFIFYLIYTIIDVFISFLFMTLMDGSAMVIKLLDDIRNKLS